MHQFSNKFTLAELVNTFCLVFWVYTTTPLPLDVETSFSKLKWQMIYTIYRMKGCIQRMVSLECPKYFPSIAGHCTRYRKNGWRSFPYMQTVQLEVIPLHTDSIAGGHSPQYRQYNRRSFHYIQQYSQRSFPSIQTVQLEVIPLHTESSTGGHSLQYREYNWSSLPSTKHSIYR